MENVSTVNQIWRLQQIIEYYRTNAYKEKLVATLLDIEKMFDSINWNILFEHLNRLKMPTVLINLIRNIYHSVEVRFIT